MSKFYAVKAGRRPGIYKTWGECEAQVKGYSGASYKAFSTQQEAETFVGLTSEKELKELKEHLPCETVEIYTDGSHKKVRGGYKGIGAYAVYKGKEYKFSAEADVPMLEQYNIHPSLLNTISNPTLEFLAFAETLRNIYLNIPRGHQPIHFIFRIDYIGVAKWLSGEWKVKEQYIKNIKEKAMFFLQEIQELSPGTQIEIQHVHGHSGNLGNDAADFLAKSTENINTFPELIQKL